jgi:hypothetical protein
MSDDEKTEQKCRDIIVEVCEVLSRYGVQQARVGAVMRLLGVDSESAKKHDDEWFVFDQDIKSMYNEIKQRSDPPPPGTTLH